MLAPGKIATTPDCRLSGHSVPLDRQISRRGARAVNRIWLAPVGVPSDPDIIGRPDHIFSARATDARLCIQAAIEWPEMDTNSGPAHPSRAHFLEARPPKRTVAASPNVLWCERLPHLARTTNEYAATMPKMQL